MPVGVFHAYEDGDISYANRQASIIFENPGRNVQGTNWLSLVHDDDKDRVQALWEQVFKRSRVVDAVCRIRGRTKIRWLHFKAVPLEVSTDGRQVALTTLEDITWHRENAIYLQEQGEFLSSIINNIPVLLVTLNAEGKTLWANERVESLLEAEPGSLNGSHFFLDHTAEGSAANSTQHQMLAGGGGVA